MKKKVMVGLVSVVVAVAFWTFSSELIIIPIWEHAEAEWQCMIRNVVLTA